MSEHHARKQRVLRHAAKGRPEQRNRLRKMLNYPATIMLGGAGLLSCTVIDASDRDASLLLDAGVESLPDEFILLFFQAPSVGRRCSMLCREGRSPSVKFLGKVRVGFLTHETSRKRDELEEENTVLLD